MAKDRDDAVGANAPADLVSIAAPVEATVTVERSVFCAHAVPVRDEAQVMGELAALRAATPKARHVVWAYALADGRTRCSDDGEPQGSSGKPTLEVLTHAGLVDTALLTTRVFGGVLLGVGGLVRAYTAAAQAALDQARRVVRTRCTPAVLTCDYGSYERLAGLAARFGGTVEDPAFAADVTFTALFRGQVPPDFLTAVREATRGCIVPTIGPTVIREVPDGRA